MNVRYINVRGLLNGYCDLNDSKFSMEILYSTFVLVLLLDLNWGAVMGSQGKCLSCFYMLSMYSSGISTQPCLNLRNLTSLWYHCDGFMNSTSLVSTILLLPYPQLIS